MSRDRRNPARSAAAGVFVALVALLLPLALVVQWAHTTVVDTDGYVEVVDAVAADPQIQESLVQQVTTMVMDQLPDLSASEAAEAGVSRIVSEAVGRVVRGSAFASVWSQANRTLHDAAISVLDGSSSTVVLGPEGQLSLDLTPVADAAREAIASSGLVSADRLPAIDAVVPVLQSDDLAKAQTAYTVLDVLTTWLPWLVALFLVFALLLARSRALALTWAGGLTLVTTGIVMLAAARIDEPLVRALSTSTVSADLIGSVAEVFGDSLVSALRLGLAAGAIMLLVAAVVALVSRARSSSHR